MYLQGFNCKLNPEFNLHGLYTEIQLSWQGTREINKVGG